MDDRPEYQSLDGYVVRRTTDRAVGIVKARSALGANDDLTWIPRSCLKNGDSVEVGEEDIECVTWKVDQEGLDY